MNLCANLVILSLAALATATQRELDKCAWGESYWCSDLRIAKSCGAFQHCKTTVWANQILPQDNSDVCKFCQSIVTDVTAFIKEKKTEDDISRFLASACTLIPSESVAAECKQLVADFVPDIIELITSEMTPQVVCSLLKLCNGLEDTVQHSKIIPVDNAIAQQPVGDSEICNDCKKFMSDIRNWLMSKEYQDQVEKMIDDAVCSLLGALENECKALVHEFLPQLINATAQYYDPNVICQPFCGSAQQTPVYYPDLKTLQFLQAFTKSESPEMCLMCKTILAEVQALSRNNQVQTTIKNFLKNDVCANMGSYNATCCALIDRYAPSVFEIIATFADPNVRCASFGFCTKSSGSMSMPAPADHTHQTDSKLTVNISPECLLCEMVMKEIDELLGNNYTEAHIIAALDKVCSLLPAKLEQSCKDFVTVYGPAILALLKQELSPAQVCTFIGLCTKSTDDEKVEVKHPTAPVNAPVNDGDVCLVCETVVQYIEALLEQNATVEEIEAVVKKVCNLLPDTFKTQCQKLIDEFATEIVHYIAEKYTPKEICTLLKLCTGHSALDSVRMLALQHPLSSRLVGTNQCSYGPSYWCASQKNAEQCGAVAHCKRFVWKN
jgi:saposin